MKQLKTYLECGEGYATPANTMGMGNPGKTGPDTLSEPIGGIEKTAKSEVEKDKKKRKKRVKSLSESLFDNNIEKDILIGDVYDLDEWTIPSFGQTDQYSLTISFAREDLWKELDKPKWKKFLKNFKFQGKYFLASDPTEPDDFWGQDVFYILTWIVFCCGSDEEIKKKCTEFLQTTLIDPKLAKARSKWINKDYYNLSIGKLEVYVLNDVREKENIKNIRMIAFKFKTQDGKDFVCCLTLKKRD